MKVLITGANGFVGKNLTAALMNIKDGKDRTHPNIQIDELYLYDINTPKEAFEKFCQDADFVYHLAGVNRPKDAKEFQEGNFGFSSTLLETLKKFNNKCPVMLASSVQASLCDRFTNSEYGKSKKAGEELFFVYGKATGAKVYVYRFPNLFGKWCRPNYNSAVATFCNNIANDLPIVVNDRNTQLELLYIDDLVADLIGLLEGKVSRCDYDGLNVIPNNIGRYCYVPVTHLATLGKIVDLLQDFHNQPQTLLMPDIPIGSFSKKLYSTYLSYLPKEKVKFAFKSNADSRGK